MEILAENVCNLTVELYGQAVRKSVKGWYKWLCYILGGILIVAASLLMGLGIAMGSTASILEAVFFLLIGIFVFVWVCALFPRVMAKRGYKQMLALNSGKPIRKTTCFYADEVEVLSSNGARARLQYANVKRVYGTERLIIAEFEGNVAVLLDKTGFVKGSPEQAQALLESRKQ